MNALSTRAQLAIGAALILLMAITRGQHFASVQNLPSASWSIFFLAGFYLRPRWVFVLLFAEASVLDFGSLASGSISDWCLSPAYWALVPAYGSLWLAGRLFAGWQRDDLHSLMMLVIVLVAVTFVAYLISGGGFYFFSGRYPEPNLTGFLPRIGEYFPRHLSNMVFYTGTALVLHIGIVSAQRLTRPRQVR